MALKNCKNGAKKMQTLKAIIKSDLQYEDCILKITFEDQVQKFTDFLEDCTLKITFKDQVQKSTDFFEDCILKITFEDQVQKSTDFF